MKELINIQSELKAPKGQTNAFGKYKYRKCEDILESLKPLLFIYKCYLTLTDEIVLIGDRYYVRAVATITNSEGISVAAVANAREALEKKGMDYAQITGAASSYSRKTALSGLLALDDAKDADAEEIVNEKTELTKTHKAWPNVVKALKSGAVVIEQVESKFSLSKKIKDELIQMQS